MVDAEWLACDDEGCQGARVRVTLLAAGFVIGASGASVRELSMKTNTTIQSWTEAPGGRDVRTRWHENHGHFSGKVANPTRVFRIKGTAESVSDAASIIREAVARYNELCADKKKRRVRTANAEGAGRGVFVPAAAENREACGK